MKKCMSCKIEKQTSEYYKNRTQKDGLQNYCKECGKSKWGKTLQCTSCPSTFYINHRNVSQRVTSLCSQCFRQYAIARIIEQNKASAEGFTVSQKGYKYVTDFSQKHKYKFEHRKIMEEHVQRPLTKEEVVHHIDGDKSNNNISNLYLTTAKEHAYAHASLERVAFELVKRGMITFDQQTGRYKLMENVHESFRSVEESSSS